MDATRSRTTNATADSTPQISRNPRRGPAERAAATALNAGDGSFADFTASGGDGANVAVTDANGDGRADVVMTIGTTDSVYLLSGAPGGTKHYASKVDALPGVSESRIAVGDVNGDGAPDAVVCGTDYLYVVALDGRAAPTLATQRVQLDDTACAVADLTGDGTADYIVAETGRLEVWSTDASGQLPSLSTLYANDDHGFPTSLTPLDVNHDGHPDLVATRQEGGFLVWPANGDGSFGSPATFMDGAKTSAPAFGDIDGDGNQDILALVNNELTVLLGDGSGSFTETELDLSLPGDAYAVATGDFDGDGRLDLAVAGSDRVWVLRNQTAH